MKKPALRRDANSFDRSAGLFSGLDGDLVARVTTAGADITIALDGDGKIVDVAARDESLEPYRLDRWRGRHLADVVSTESVQKIERMRRECAETGASKPHQVNHSAPDLPDLPVNYVLMRFPGLSVDLAFGQDLRVFAQMQQQLVQTQFELEREYRKVREAETRYRSVFQKLRTGVAVVSRRDMQVLDANAAASSILYPSGARLSGQSLRNAVERGDRDRLAAAVTAACESGVSQTIEAAASSNGGPIRIEIEPFREHGAVNCIAHVEAIRSDSNNGGVRFREFADSMPEALVTLDAKGAILDANERFIDLVRVLQRSSVVGANLNNWLGASNMEVHALLTRTREERQIQAFPSVIRDEAGASRPVRVSASWADSSGGERFSLLISEQLQRETTLAAGGVVAPGASRDFSELVGRVPLKELIREASDVIERLCIEAALRKTGNNRASAAEMLGLSRQSLYIKLRRHDLESFDGRD
jgi:transcriptional regulator PpsR